jgi:hypothetical protein
MASLAVGSWGRASLITISAASLCGKDAVFSWSSSFSALETAVWKDAASEQRLDRECDLFTFFVVEIECMWSI